MSSGSQSHKLREGDDAADGRQIAGWPGSKPLALLGVEPVTFKHRVRYHETDQQGFLFNARFLELGDVALTEFFRALGWDYLDLVAAGVDPSVVSATLEFSAPARFDDILDVTVGCTNVGRSSFALAVSISRLTVSVAQLALVYVNVDPVAAVAQPLPTVIADAMRTRMAVRAAE